MYCNRKKQEESVLKQEESDKSKVDAGDILSFNAENDPDFTPSKICVDRVEIEKNNRSVANTVDTIFVIS